MTAQSEMTQPELSRIVETIVEKRLGEKETVPTTWLIHAVVKKFPDVRGDDVGFYRLCAFGHVGDTVRAVLRARKERETKPDADEDDLFPGLDRVQRAYTIPRTVGDETEQIVVPTEDMTDDEIRAKAAELDRFGRGAIAHGEELLKYLKMRRKAG